MNKRTILTNEVLVYAYLGMFAAEIAMVTPFLFIEFWVGVFLMFWVIFSIVVACCITERWCLMIVLDAEGILYKPLFRSGRRLKYSNYPRVQYAYYMHGNWLGAYKVHFFVLTNKRLSDEELSHINEVAPSIDLLKIRYTRRNYRKLVEALPPSIAAEIEGIYDVYIAR